MGFERPPLSGQRVFDSWRDLIVLGTIEQVGVNEALERRRERRIAGGVYCVSKGAIALWPAGAQLADDLERVPFREDVDNVLQRAVTRHLRIWVLVIS